MKDLDEEYKDFHNGFWNAIVKPALVIVLLIIIYNCLT